MPLAENWRSTLRAFEHFGMRFAALVAVLALSGACATRDKPYRFASPLLGSVDVPADELPGEDRQQPGRSRRAAPVRVAGGWQADAQAAPIRTVSARGIDAKMPAASAEAAASIARGGNARAVVWSRLPAPHRTAAPPQPGGVMASIQIPTIREPTDLRRLVGQRDKRPAFTIVLDWLAELGIGLDASPADGPALVGWARGAGKLAAPFESARPGDLLVFDRANGDGPADLIALVIARDARGVTEFMYAGGGVIRRGFLDPTRGSTRRDLDGAIVNTFLRHGKLWPPKGTRYLSGELVSGIVRTR